MHPSLFTEPPRRARIRAARHLAWARVGRALLIAGLGGAVLVWWSWPEPPVPQVRLSERGWQVQHVPASETTAERASADGGQALAPTDSLPAPAALTLCGVGPWSPGADQTRLDTDDAQEALPPHLGKLALDNARERTLAALRQGSGRARVAALLWAPPPAEATSAVRQAWAQELLLQARQSRDPVALKWAEPACAEQADGPECRRRLVQQRLQLQPSNGLHWAALAAEDEGAQQQAWRGLQTAQSWQDDPQAFSVTVQAAIPPDVPGYLRLSLSSEALSLQGGLAEPALSLMDDRCGAMAPDEGERQACQNVARLLVSHSDSVAALARGQQLGQQAGWPATEVAAVARELKTLNSAAARWRPDPAQPMGCASAQSLEQHLGAFAQLGELGALRERLALR